MNKKIAIFVEGLTEQIFIESLIMQIEDKEIESIFLTGGSKKSKPRIFEIKGNPDILIVNCGQDERVKSDIQERCEGLKKAGFQKIIGIRDARPEAKNNSEISKLRQGLVSGFAPDINVQFILCIMECEAWLMSEYNHFSQIHSAITTERIKQELGIDVINDNLSHREHPSKDLTEIYWLERINYDKSRRQLSDIVSKLDQKFLRSTVASKFDDLQLLYREFDSFFSNN